jgi:hypothetical protein
LSNILVVSSIICQEFDVKKFILLMNITSISKEFSLHLSIIVTGIVFGQWTSKLVGDPLVIFPLRLPRLAPNLSLAILISSMGVLTVW